jgi:dihydrofolate synthase/folylpolyglutamate synthase
MTAPGSDVILARMMALHPKIIDLTLDRVWRLLDALGNPQDALPPVIHIAGTNGKGSTQAMIRAGLEAGGARVHAYTSPHLARFHERLAMARVPADYTLLEVGLGGRLDATNVIARPALTIITPVSMDHEGYLGDTLAKIAGEKARIIKRQVPCVVGPQEEAALAVIEAEAARLGAPLIAQGQHWHVWEERGRLVFQDESGLCDLPLPNLPGAHQRDNAGAAIAALRALGRGEAALEGAVTSAFWPARMQRLGQGPIPEAAPEAEIWLDGGHNPAAGLALAQHLATLPPRPTHLVCGMLNTKDIAGYLVPLAAQALSLTAVSIPGEAATLPAEATAQAARAVGLKAQTAESALAAVRQIAAQAPRARILICGSLYLAGGILRENG